MDAPLSVGYSVIVKVSFILIHIVPDYLFDIAGRIL